MATARSPLLHRFAPHVAELPIARRALREWLLSDGDTDADAVQELLVVATELCTHAVRATSPGLVTLRAWDEGDAVVVEVESMDGVVEASAVVRNFEAPLDDEGRGMLIVQSLCDEMSVVVRGRSRFVRCRKRLAAAQV